MLRRPAAARALAAIVFGSIAGAVLLKSIPTRVTLLAAVSADVTHLFGDVAGNFAAVAPDGSFLVIDDSTKSQPRMLIWDLAAHAARIELPTSRDFNRPAISADSTLVAGVDSNGSVRVWSAQGRPQRMIWNVNPTLLVGLSFSADNRLLAIGEKHGVRIFRIADGRLTALLGADGDAAGLAGKPTAPGSRVFVTGVDFGSQANRLVVSGSSFIETVELDDTGRVRSRHVLSEQGNISSNLVQSADGRYLAFDADPLTRSQKLQYPVIDRLASADRSVVLYRLSSGTTYSRAMALSPRGEVLAFGAGASASDPLRLVDMRKFENDPGRRELKILFDASRVATPPANQKSLWAVRFIGPTEGDRRTRYEITRRSLETIIPPVAPSMNKLAEGTNRPPERSVIESNPNRGAKRSKKAPDIQAPQTRAPLEETQAPVAQTQAPVTQAQAPVAQTQAPVAQIQAPVAQIQAPVAQIQAPVAQIQAPVAQIQASVAQGTLNQAPLTQAPLSQAPLNQAPLNQAPLNQAPVAQTQAPSSSNSPSNVIAQTHFILPRDARYNDGDAIGPFCCDGYTAEVHGGKGGVIGYIHLAFTRAPSKNTLEPVASKVTITVSALRDLVLTVAKPESDSRYAMSAPLELAPGDYAKKREVILTAGAVSFRVRIEYALIVSLSGDGLTAPANLQGDPNEWFFDQRSLQVAVDVVRVPLAPRGLSLTVQ
jgi:hypothetical protein